MKTTYVHTNIVARDWKKLAQFYTEVFDCEPVYPERDLSGDWMDQLTGIEHVKIRGIHLRLPGGENGPTLEIFEYAPPSTSTGRPRINNAGFGHIAFQVENVEETIEKILAAGGDKYGELIEKEIAGIGTLKAIYTTDPEGNIVEIQHWGKP